MNKLKYVTFQGDATPIESIDITRIALGIGVGEDEVHAFTEVEANGSGFDSKGRPKMLFEPHLFYRYLKGDQRDRAVSQGLAYSGWRSGGYPRDSYPRMHKAMEINPEAALRAASWGASQVLGNNYEMLGYLNVFQMVDAFCADGENHIQGMIDFANAAGIADDLRVLAALKRPTKPSDCVAIVRVYNGPGFAKNNYHTKFATAHNKWRRIDDTEFSEAEIGYPTLSIGAKGPLVQFAQEMLRDLKYPVGAIDKDFGPSTRDAVLAFQANSNLPLTGRINRDTWDILIKNPVESPIGESRKGATVADLRDKGSQIVKTAETGQATGGVLAGGATLAGAAGLVDTAEGASGLLSRATAVIDPFKDFLATNWMFCIGAAGAYLIWQGHQQKQIRLQDHRNGFNKSR